MLMLKKLSTSINAISILRERACIVCKRTEKMLIGTTRIGDKNVDIFSNDGLCLDCEIKQFPERFHGCGFCKRPIREKFSCTICAVGFADWVNESIHPIDSIAKLIRSSATALLDKSVHNLPISNRQFIMRNDDGIYKWPGFYAGVTNKFSSGQRDLERARLRQKSVKKKPHIDIEYSDVVTINSDSESTSSNSDARNSDIGNGVVIDENKEEIVTDTEIVDQTNFFPVWIIPKLTKSYKFDLRLDIRLFQTTLLEILEKNHINLYDDVQIDPEVIEHSQISRVNPYDTRVIKPVAKKNIF